MTDKLDYATDTGSAMVAKLTPPVTVSLATLAGYNLSELVLFATLVYTCIMAVKTFYSFIMMIYDRHFSERRIGLPDEREDKVERRGK